VRTNNDFSLFTSNAKTFPFQVSQWSIYGYFCHAMKGLFMRQLHFIQQLPFPSCWFKQLDSKALTFQWLGQIL
jgi:hypothetical protein